jgi:hypothetical protein
MELHDSVAAWLASLGTLPREAYTASRRPGAVKLDATHTARFESGMVRARGAGTGSEQNGAGDAPPTSEPRSLTVARGMRVGSRRPRSA